jgi:CheY-like chemotaxis protein
MARVLIVDDTEIVRRALEVAVRRLGHEAESATEPQSALRIATERPPDLALLDFRMPGMDGVTLWTRMRDALGDRCPKVLFVSGSPPEEVRSAAEASEARVVGYVRKPSHLDDLSKLVADALAA